MEGDNVSVAFPLCSNMTASEITDTGTILEEGPRICPLCNSIIRLFFINFNEKLLMCENTECEFPFGHEELQFVKEDSELQIHDEVTSIQSQLTQESSATCSVVSGTAWSEIDKINRVCDSEDSQFDFKPPTANDKECNMKKQMVQRENEKKILDSLNNIKQLNTELGGPARGPKLCLKNEKWIRNLKSLQELSGVQLLRKQEIDKLKNKKSNIGLKELKIDIDSSNSLSSIKIEVASKEKES